MLLFIGDLDEEHGADLLLRAMPSILRSDSQVRLYMVGHGPLRESLAAYARYLQLDRIVSILPVGASPDLADTSRGADILVVPARQAVSQEPIWAAWSAGKPVVATHEAASEIAEHEKDALLVYPSENSIAAAVMRLLQDPTLARKLGEAGRQKYQSRLAGESPR